MNNSESVLSPFKKGSFVLFLALSVIFFGFTSFTQAINLPETGQNTCYS